MNLNANGSPVTGGNEPVGAVVPINCPHAILNSLPTWLDVVEYMDNKEWAIQALKTSYPRVQLHTYVAQLSKVCSDLHGSQDEECLLFPSSRIAEHCQAYIRKRSGDTEPRIVPFKLPIKDNPTGISLLFPDGVPDLFAVFCPSSSFSRAMQFWLYTGTGISSRLAEHCLSSLPEGLVDHSALTIPLSPRIWRDADFYHVHKPLESGVKAKAIIQKLFSGIIDDGPDNVRGVSNISPDDMYLYSTGMNAIWEAHMMMMHTQSKRQKCAAFNLLFAHTHGMLENWGPGYHFFSNGSIDDFEAFLALEHARNPSQPPISALYIDFPSNPLLRSPDISHLRKLADQYDFVIIIDETVGNFLTVQLLPYADIVTCSLTKIFSGLANVMGGAFLLNPTSKHYRTFKTYLDANYEYTYFSEDAICMEANSRDIKRRVRMIDRNAGAIADLCYDDSLKEGSVIDRVLYPKYHMRENYERCWSKYTPDPGYGGLLTVVFISTAAATAFYDSLTCYKAISFGTVFTLAVPFAVAGFNDRLEWAQENGIDYPSVRFSIGLEDLTSLKDCFKLALSKAEDAEKKEAAISTEACIRIVAARPSLAAAI
ncbi:PLP-dependent transferase [Desarmillaria tabescens]|uniref:PLP-dependent transferase n=1 Tax=Armillaria tabescens TaxID=1929756 RepID=A0AA39JAG4_ARMTA|nr:PLP-dependent transferase [Desarmillaria tabescens]KAK0438357.1 PLP-dependent transferase [Desarmillaria tabescens]